jgi:hypothetical protein
VHGSCDERSMTEALPEDDRLAADLLVCLEAIFGPVQMQKVRGAAPAEVLATQWAKGLKGLSPIELERGLGHCRHRACAPALGEFVLLCRPAADPEYAWHEAKAGLSARQRGEQGQWSHPAVYRAAMQMHAELQTGSFRVSAFPWSLLLARELVKGWGEGVPAAPVVLSGAADWRPAPAHVRARLEELRSELNALMKKGR